MPRDWHRKKAPRDRIRRKTAAKITVNRLIGRSADPEQLLLRRPGCGADDPSMTSRIATPRRLIRSSTTSCRATALGRRRQEGAHRAQLDPVHDGREHVVVRRAGAAGSAGGEELPDQFEVVARRIDGPLDRTRWLPIALSSSAGVRCPRDDAWHRR
jgi:hypothetical protein